jgi:hypothetical protein
MLLAVLLAMTLCALSAYSQPSTYTFSRIATLGESLPHGGTMAGNFEHMAINNRGDTSFGAYLSQGGEGMFSTRGAPLIEITYTGANAPGGGGYFDPWGLCGGPTAINPSGDIAFTFALSPYNPDTELNCGLYRYSQNHQTFTPVLVPGITPAPTGGTFFGASSAVGLSANGDLVFTGLFPSKDGRNGSVGWGIFLAGNRGITKIVASGDPAPGGSSQFDFTWNPSINDGGDIGFGAHVKGEHCYLEVPAKGFCAESIYLREAGHGRILSIAHQGQDIPADAGGGKFYYAFGAVINNKSEIAFIGGLSDADDQFGVFLWSRGMIFKVARPGDPMPGGGKFAAGTFYTGNYGINDSGQVSFAARLDNGDRGVYVWSHGTLSLVAKNGTAVPPVGVIQDLDWGNPFLYGVGGVINDHGEVVFAAHLTNGEGVLLRASPR